MQKSSWAKLAVALIVLVLLVVLIVQNSHDVSLELWFWTVTGPLVILLAVTGGLGIILGAILARTKFKKQ